MHLKAKKMLLLSVAMLSLGSGSVAIAAPPSVPPPSPLARIPFVTVAGDVVTVDVARNPDALTALAQDDAALEGKAVRIIGMKGLSPETRARIDSGRLTATSSVGAAPAQAACPDRPGGPRSNNGATRPALGCDSAGSQKLGAAIEGKPEVTLAKALELTVRRYLPGAGDLGPKVTIEDGVAQVAFPDGFSRARALLSGDQMSLSQDLLAAAFTNGSISGVRFTVAGDCMEFAMALGGDSCSTILFDEIPE